MNVAARVGLAVTVPMFVVGALFGPQIRAAHAAPPLVATRTVPLGGTGDVRAIDLSSAISDDNDDDKVDLYGNPVTDAVAKYQLDAAGSLYESHSPQTELPRLASPKS